MPYPFSFTSLTLNGTLADGNEIFSAGLHLASVVNMVPDAEWNSLYTPISESIATRCEAFFSAVATCVPTGASLTSIKLARIGTDGKYLGEPIEVPTTASGGVNSSYAPQNAIVNTLVSDKFKDPGKYNRFYLPFANRDPLEEYQLTSLHQNEYAAELADFVGDLNVILADGLTPYYEAVSVVSASGAGNFAPAVEVRIGRVIDTQRRRRNKLPESYVSVAVPPLP